MAHDAIYSMAARITRLKLDQFLSSAVAAVTFAVGATTAVY